MKKEKDERIVTNEESSSQENKEQGGPLPNRGLSRREVLKKAAWMVPVILSTQLSGEAFARPPENRGRPESPGRSENRGRSLSCVVPGDNCTCTPAGDDSCSRCEIKICDNTPEDTVLCCETGECSNNCDYCDGSWWDICNPNF